MNSPMRSLPPRPTLPRLLSALLLCLAWLVLWAPPAAHARSNVQVLASDAQATFGSDVVFSLVASSPDTISEVDLLYGTTRGDGMTIVPLAVTPAQQIDVQHTLDTRIFYLPPGVELRYRWLIRDAAGNEYESAEQTLVYEDTRFNWQQRSERGITVYWYAGGDAFGEELIGTATRTLDRLEAELDATISDPIKIYIYANGQDMRGALRSNSVEWVGGQAFPGLGIVLGMVAPGNVAEVRRIVPHELSHQVLHQVLDNPYGGWPLWFDEGLAVYNQETPDVAFAPLLDDAARAGTLIPLEALAASFPADTERALLSYAQSHSVVVYIVEEYGLLKLAALSNQFRQAVTVETAVQEVFGMSVDELDAAWRSTLPSARSDAAPALEGGPSRAPADRFSAQPSGLPAAAGAPVLGSGASLAAGLLLVPLLMTLVVLLARRIFRPAQREG